MHKAFHSHGCIGCASTYCNYCCQEHIKEGKDCTIITFKEFGSKFLNPLLQKISLMKDYNAKQENLLDEIDQSSSQLKIQEENFKEFIKERKLVVLSQMLFLLELTGKQVLSNFQRELKEYESAKMKIKDETDKKLNLVKEVLEKSETLAGKSLMEIISQTKGLQDEFQAVLPEVVIDEEIYLPEFQVKMENEDVTVDYTVVDNLFVDIQGSFADMKLTTMINDGRPESIEKLINTNSNTVDYSSSIFTRLNSASESSKYANKI